MNTDTTTHTDRLGELAAVVPPDGMTLTPMLSISTAGNYGSLIWSSVHQAWRAYVNGVAGDPMPSAQAAIDSFADRVAKAPADAELEAEVRAEILRRRAEATYQPGGIATTPHEAVTA